MNHSIKMQSVNEDKIMAAKIQSAANYILHYSNTF